MHSYQESSGRLKEFAESLKSHLEINGYNVMDNPGRNFDKPLIGNKKNIIFSSQLQMLFVYYENDNDEAENSILSYWDSIKNELGIRGLQGLRSAHSSFVKFVERELE
jgi:hypothetical protein